MMRCTHSRHRVRLAVLFTICVDYRRCSSRFLHLQQCSVYGMIAKITAVAGKRDEFVEVLTKSTSRMPGCLSYIVAEDSRDANVVWVTEVWDNAASHEASFTLPEVQSAISQAKSLVAAFERVAITIPVREMGLGFHSGS
jgi:quinol monooxygenase YgiN